MKYIVCSLILAGCFLTTGCVRRTVSEEPAFRSTARQKNPARQSPVVEDQTYWIWQGGFWNRENK